MTVSCANAPITSTPRSERGDSATCGDNPKSSAYESDRRAVIDLAELRGIHNIRVFGSVARGDDHQGSDIDPLVDVDDGVGLVALAGVARELSDPLGAPVDVIPADSLKRAIRADVLAEALPL